MSETLTERIKHWNDTNPNEIMQAFSSDLYEIVARAEAAEARNADLLEENREQAEAVTTLTAEREGLVEWRDAGAEEIETLRAEVAELKQLHLLRGEALDVLKDERDATRRELERAQEDRDDLREALDDSRRML